MHFEAEVFVAVGFVIFLGVLLKAGAHVKVFSALDARIDRVKSELAEAQKLRAEAEALLASFENKRAEAEAEAAAIVASEPIPISISPSPVITTTGSSGCASATPNPIMTAPPMAPHR